LHSSLEIDLKITADSHVQFLLVNPYPSIIKNPTVIAQKSLPEVEGFSMVFDLLFT